MLGGDVDDTIRGFHPAGLCVGKNRPARHHAHLRAVHQPNDALVQPIDDAVLPFDHAPEVEPRRGVERNAERIAAYRIGHAGIAVGSMDQRLRRDAAANEAGAAEPVALDQYGVEAELTGTDRGDIAAHAAADHQHTRAQGFGHHLPRTTIRIPGESREPLLNGSVAG